MKEFIIALFIGLLTVFSFNNINHTDITEKNDYPTHLSSWNEEDVYNFLEEVEQQLRKIPVETASLDPIVEQYELFFSTELSNEIVAGNYIETENGWMIPDGDAGYIFSVPSRGTEESEVNIDFTDESIKIIEIYEFGMFKEFGYTIELIDDTPKITEWIRVFD